MTHRPYPSRNRSLRHVRSAQAAYHGSLYRHFPQRVVLGLDQPDPGPTGLQQAFAGFNNIRSQLLRAKPPSLTAPWPQPPCPSGRPSQKALG